MRSVVTSMHVFLRHEWSQAANCVAYNSGSLTTCGWSFGFSTRLRMSFGARSDPASWGDEAGSDLPRALAGVRGRPASGGAHRPALYVVCAQQHASPWTGLLVNKNVIAAVALSEAVAVGQFRM